MAYISHHHATSHGLHRGQPLKSPPIAWSRVAFLAANLAFWVALAVIVAGLMS